MVTMTASQPEGCVTPKEEETQSKLIMNGTHVRWVACVMDLWVCLFSNHLRMRNSFNRATPARQTCALFVVSRHTINTNKAFMIAIPVHSSISIHPASTTQHNKHNTTCSSPPYVVSLGNQAANLSKPQTLPLSPTSWEWRHLSHLNCVCVCVCMHCVSFY